MWYVYFTVSTASETNNSFELVESECIDPGTERPSDSGGSSSSNTGLIAGIVVGVCAVVVVITIIVIVILIRNKNNNQRKNANEDPSRNDYSSDPTASRLVSCDYYQG